MRGLRSITGLPLRHLGTANGSCRSTQSAVHDCCCCGLWLVAIIVQLGDGAAGPVPPTSVLVGPLFRRSGPCGTGNSATDDLGRCGAPVGDLCKTWHNGAAKAATEETVDNSLG